MIPKICFLIEAHWLSFNHFVSAASEPISPRCTCGSGDGGSADPVAEP
jgi:hypothetical protein